MRLLPHFSVKTSTPKQKTHKETKQQNEGGWHKESDYSFPQKKSNADIRFHSKADVSSAKTMTEISETYTFTQLG